MGNITTVLKLLPLLIRVAEIIYGTKNGVVKKHLVVTVFLGLLELFFPAVDRSKFAPVLSEMVDVLVATLTETGVLLPHTSQ